MPAAGRERRTAVVKTLIRHGLEDEHLRCGPPLLLLRRRVDTMRSPVHSQAVNLRLDGHIPELPEVRRVIHLEDRDRSARTRDVDTTKSRVEHHDVRPL